MKKTMRAVRIAAFDDLDAISLGPVAVPNPGEGEVLVEVAAAPVNYVDLVTMRGAYQFKPALPYTSGKGPAGTVAAVGPGVTCLAVGERVLAMAEYGGHAEFCLAPADQTYRLPAGMSFLDAAAMSLAYDTAWVALVDRARLRPGDHVLVLGATGAVGSAAVQLAKAMGAASVIAGVSSAARATEVERNGADGIVDLSAEDLRNHVRDRVLELTDQHGADVVIDMLGGDPFDGAVRAVAWRGRLVVVGFAAGRIPDLRMNYPLLKNIEVSGLQISDYRKRMPELMRRCYDEVFDLASRGLLVPPPVTSYALTDWRDAVDALAGRAASGRLVLVP